MALMLQVLRSFSKYPFTDLDASPRASAASAAPNAAPVSRPVAPAKQSPPAPAVVQYTESGKQIPVGNGGAADSYTWTQSLEDVTIQLNVPEGTKSKDLDCRITTAHIRVGWKNDRSAVPLLDGDLPEKIRVDESVWSLEGNRTLQLSLEKIKPTWWASAFTGDSEIDTSRVDSTRKIDEYDATTQGAIRKAMFDQQQQQRGLRSSDDLILEQMLAKAKRAPHSPI